MEIAHEAFEKLCEKYPVIFQDSKYSPRESCMGRGQEFPEAWYDMIDALCESLQWNTDRNGYPQVVFEQIKEKFGRLRIYHRVEKTKDTRGKWFKENCAKIDGMIAAYETFSSMICDTCGTNQNIIQKSGWIRYVCKDCDKRQTLEKKISHVKWKIKTILRKFKIDIKPILWPY